MGKPIDRAGIFKAAAGGEHTIEESKDGAVAVSVKFAITHWLDGDQWQPWEQYEFEVYAKLWLIKKDKSTNENAVKTLRDVLGWDGDLESVGQARWALPAVQVVVKDDPYKGESRFKAEWINPLDYVPEKKVSTVAPDKVKALKTQFGPQLRAIYGMKPVTSAPPSAPPPPVPSAKPKTATLPPPPVIAKGVHGTKQRAWTAFGESNMTLANPHGPEALQGQWLRIYSQFFGDRDETTLTPADWLKMEQEGPAEMTPF